LILKFALPLTQGPAYKVAMAHATRQDAHNPGKIGDAGRDEQAFDLLRGVAAYTGNGLVAALARALGRHPGARLDEAFNHKQVACKAWARDQLFLSLGGRFERIWIVGGWYGVLAAMIFDDPRFSVGEIASFDIDPAVAPVALTLNAKAGARFKAITADMYAIDYAGPEGPDLVVNTSCEHVTDFGGWLDRLPSGTAALLQSNDYFAEREHINCMSSLAAFEKAASLSALLYSGELPLKKYARFMLIGRR
jgi:hypothetical protein